MKINIRLVLFLSIISLIDLRAQVGIGTTTPDPSAALHVYSNTKGFLPPVMTESNRDAISNPAEGLMVYCSDCNAEGYYVYINSSWTNLLDGEDVFGLATVNTTSVHGGNNNLQAGNVSYNTALGYGALQNSMTNSHTAVGGSALLNLQSGSSNTALGYAAAEQLQSGNYNVIVGSHSLQNASGGDNNVLIGDSAMASATTASANVAIGAKTGALNSGGDSNVYIGNYAGYSASGSGKLYIENSNSSVPLIGGDFTSNRVGINKDINDITSGGATLQVGGDISLLNGVAINEFSSDGGMTDNSHTAVPTEGAVKSYVDAQIGTVVSENSISTDVTLSGNSEDSLVTQKALKTYVENQTALKVSPDLISTDASLSGNSNDSLSSQYAIKTYVTNELATLDLDAVVINRMSTDVTLTGNSNDSLPSQRAIKTYLDNSIAALDLESVITNKMSTSQNLIPNSDDYVPTQKAVKGYVDNMINYAIQDISPLTNIKSIDASLSGNSHDSIPSQAAVKTYVDNLETQLENEPRLTQAIGSINYHSNINNMLNISTAAGSNMAIGKNALNQLISGDRNTAIGSESLNSNTTGNYNTAVGDSALGSVNSGSYNTALGQSAGSANDGDFSVFAGRYSGTASSGGSNTYLGAKSGWASNGDSNVFVGYYAGASAHTNRSVFLGYGAGANETNDARLYIANSNTSTPLIGGDFDANIVSINLDINSLGSHTLQVGGDASKSVAGSWAANSDRRLKKDIEYMNSEKILNKMLQLKGATYLWNDTVTGIPRPENIQYGFIAQDIEKVWPSKISRDRQGYLVTAYGDYDPMFVESIRALDSYIKDLEVQNNELKNTLSGLSMERGKMTSEIAKLTLKNDDLQQKADQIEVLANKLSALEKLLQD